MVGNNMGVRFQNLVSSRALLKAARAAASYTACLAVILSVSAGSAWSLDRTQPSQAFEASSYTSQLPPPSMADSCLPLLNTRHTTPVSDMDRTQRTAGTAAALGIVFGVRFALGPKETAKSNRTGNARLTIWQPANATAGDQHALAVADYRNCQKEQALKALNEFRWTR
jgi:hypothetical protein